MNLFFGVVVSFLGIVNPTPNHKISLKAYTWERYTNVRFAFSILYPRELLVAQGESGNSDGQAFDAKSGAELLVYGRNDMGQKIAPAALATAKEHAGSAGQTTYKRIKGNWFVVSGKGKKGYFYCKGILRDGTFKLFELTYPESEAATYNSLVPRLVAGFHDLK